MDNIENQRFTTLSTDSTTATTSFSLFFIKNIKPKGGGD